MRFNCDNASGVTFAPTRARAERPRAPRGEGGRAKLFQLSPTRELPKQDLIKEFTDRKVDLGQAFVSTGMGDLQTKMLTLAEAKKRKGDMVLQSRKQQRLLQTEQHKAIK
ncbi:hypothetical protein ABBQ38_003403 [Trebouxia sp. C0009 RCD-2024]